MVIALTGLRVQTVKARRCIMKALILASDKEEGFQDEEEPFNSCMRMFKGKHLIQYSLDAAILSKVEEILIVVGYGAETIINAFGITYRDIRVKYVLQKELCGSIDAIGQAREALEDDDFILLKGDEIVCDPHPYEMIENFYEQDLFVECGVVQVLDTQEIGNTYGVIYDPYDYRIYRIVDKPRRPTNSYMGTGICVFRNEILEYLDQTSMDKPRQGGEIPDLVQCVIDDGYPVKLFVIGSGYVHVNTVDDLRIAEQERVEGHAKWRKLEPVFQ
jgi:NDP-sugar pyrophosphorylase family protein